MLDRINRDTKEGGFMVRYPHESYNEYFYQYSEALTLLRRILNNKSRMRKCAICTS